MTGKDGPLFLVDRWLAIGANIVSYIWKWMPFWTLIFVAARMAIPQDIYEAADIDGATGYRRLVHVTFPLLANVYLISTLLSTVWTIGDFNTVYFVSSGAPAQTDRCAGHLWLPRGVRLRLPEPWRRGDDVGAAGAHPAGDPADAAGPRDGGAAMSIALTPVRSAYRPRCAAGACSTKAAAVVLGVGLLIWTLLPVYNMLLIALDSDGDEFTGSIWPPDPESGQLPFGLDRRLLVLEHFWHQFGNSFYMGSRRCC